MTACYAFIYYRYRNDHVKQNIYRHLYLTERYKRVYTEFNRGGGDIISEK